MAHGSQLPSARAGDETDTDRLIGQVFGDTYRIERLLGEGGMGSVYEASHARIMRRFAIKVLHGVGARDAEALSRFEREAMIGSRLGHNHIVQVFDFNRTPAGAPYLVMELLEGQDLGAIVECEGQLPIVRAGSIVRQVCQALMAAHEHGIVHRDLKPGNVFICDGRGITGEVAKVLDFGISKMLASQSIVTEEGAICGTPTYMAPEQAVGEVSDVDQRTDLFALGSILYRMLSGRDAFDAPNVPAVLFRVVHEAPTPLRELRPDVPWELVRFVNKAISKRPQDRFQSAREMLLSLQQAMVSQWKVVLAWEISPELAGHHVARPAGCGDPQPANASALSVDATSVTKSERQDPARTIDPASSTGVGEVGLEANAIAAPSRRIERTFAPRPLVGIASLLAIATTVVALAVVFLRSSPAEPTVEPHVRPTKGRGVAEGTGAASTASTVPEWRGRPAQRQSVTNEKKPPADDVHVTTASVSGVATAVRAVAQVASKRKTGVRGAQRKRRKKARHARRRGTPLRSVPSSVKRSDARPKETNAGARAAKPKGKAAHKPELGEGVLTSW